MAEFKHITVLLKEAVAGLDINPAGKYVDATLGGGGHTSAILKQLDSGHLFRLTRTGPPLITTRPHLPTRLVRES